MKQTCRGYSVPAIRSLRLRPGITNSRRTVPFGLARQVLRHCRQPAFLPQIHLEQVRGRAAGVISPLDPGTGILVLPLGRIRIAVRGRARSRRGFGLLAKAKNLPVPARGSRPRLLAVSEEEKKLWRFKKQSMAKYRFAQDFRQGNWMDTISLQEIFSLAVLTGKLGFMNWIRANAHIYKSRNRKKSAAVMVFLVAAEILRPASIGSKGTNQARESTRPSIRWYRKSGKKVSFIGKTTQARK